MAVHFELKGLYIAGSCDKPEYLVSPATSFVTGCEAAVESNACRDDEYLLSLQVVSMEESMPAPERSAGLIPSFLNMVKFSFEILLNV